MFFIMEKIKKIVSFMLLVSMLSSIFLPIFCKEKTIFAEEKYNQRVMNGWIDITKYGVTMWYYKTYGQFKTGWHYDNYYEGWYYFSPEHNFMFDPRYNNSEWLSINNKWYWFNIGGKLKELNGWERYGDEWIYHVPGDYGALAGCLCKIGSKYYIFNYNGYMTYEGNTAPDLSKLRH